MKIQDILKKQGEIYHNLTSNKTVQNYNETSDKLGKRIDEFGKKLSKIQYDLITGEMASGLEERVKTRVFKLLMLKNIELTKQFSDYLDSEKDGQLTQEIKESLQESTVACFVNGGLTDSVGTGYSETFPGTLVYGVPNAHGILPVLEGLEEDDKDYFEAKKTEELREIGIKLIENLVKKSKEIGGPESLTLEHIYKEKRKLIPIKTKEEYIQVALEEFNTGLAKALEEEDLEPEELAEVCVRMKYGIKFLKKKLEYEAEQIYK